MTVTQTDIAVEGAVGSVCVSCAGIFIAVNRSIFSLNQGILNLVVNFDETIRKIVFLNGTLYAITPEDNTLYSYDLNSQKLNSRQLDSEPSDLVVSSSSVLVGAGHALIELNTELTTSRVLKFDGLISSLNFDLDARDETLLVVDGYRVWAVDLKKLEKTFVLKHGECLTSAFKDDRNLFVGDTEGRLFLKDHDILKALDTERSLSSNSHRVNDIIGILKFKSYYFSVSVNGQLEIHGSDLRLLKSTNYDCQFTSMTLKNQQIILGTSNNKIMLLNAS